MEELDKNKKLYILLGLLLIICFVILTSLIKSNLNSKIDYNSDDVVADLLKSATITYDREVYYIMEDIIVKYISSYNLDYALGGENSYEDYYEVLEKNYKSKLGKSKYKEVAQNFFKSVEYTGDTGMDVSAEYITTNIIRAIYDLGDNRYLCKIGLLVPNSYGYIGISINTSDNSYEIFYIE